MLYGAIKVKMWPVFIFIWNKCEHWSLGTIFTVITIIKRVFSLCSYLALKLLNWSLDTNLNFKSQFLLQKHENLICTASLKKNFILFLYNEKIKKILCKCFFLHFFNSSGRFRFILILNQFKIEALFEAWYCDNLFKFLNCNQWQRDSELGVLWH